jgi:acyl-CoA reductase-like NAD-dependent aldehyde dehydrogenase
VLLESYVAGRWQAPPDEGSPLLDASTGEQVALLPSSPVRTAEALAHARSVGGPALRALTFPQRAAALKALGAHLMAVKDDFASCPSRPEPRSGTPRSTWTAASARCWSTPARAAASCRTARCWSTARSSSSAAAAPSSGGTS